MNLDTILEKYFDSKEYSQELKAQLLKKAKSIKLSLNKNLKSHHANMMAF